MSNPDPPIEISVQAIRDYAAALDVASENLKKIAMAMENAEFPSVMALSYPTGKKGLDQITRFCAALSIGFGNQLANRTLTKTLEEKTAASAKKKTEEALETLKKAKKPKN